MPKLIITSGVSSSGKSTYAKELIAQGWAEINRDYWRFKQYCNGVNDWSLYKFTKAKEDFVTFLCDHDWECAVDQKLNIIVSNTNLNQKDHNYWKTKAESVGYEFEVKYFPITFEEALKRDSKRGALAVGREVLIQQWQKWLIISGYKRYTPDVSKPKAIICDLDGTIAVNTHRGHHDYDKVSTDTPRESVISLVRAWGLNQGFYVIFMSGRPDSCMEASKQWIRDHLPIEPLLYMRKTGDMRSDRIVKEELFWEHLVPHYNVIAAIDDRPRVVRLWQDLGIETVINVQRGYDEF